MSTTTGYALRCLASLKKLIYVPSAFVAGGLAACGAVTVTHGFETVKIR